LTSHAIFASPADGTVTIETFGRPNSITLWLYATGESSLWRHRDSPWVTGMRTGDELVRFRLDTLADHLEWASDERNE
jgi:hypothetical protein